MKIIITIFIILSLFFLYDQTTDEPFEVCKNTTTYAYYGNDLDCKENCVIPKKITKEECTHVKIQRST